MSARADKARSREGAAGAVRAALGAICVLQMVCAAFAAPQILAQVPVTAPVNFQTAIPANVRSATDATTAASAQPGRVTLDRVVAVVNGEPLLESEVDAEERFAAFQPFSMPQPISRDSVIERLIDRTLILQQMALDPEPRVSDADVDEQLDALRKAIPECAAYRCETDAGWQKFAADHGFTVDEVRERWRQRMDVLRYIEERFRSGITIPQAEVDDYYQKTMLPQYAKQKAAPPTEASLADRIQEILLQQRVDKLLDDWLTALRAQGSVVTMPGEEAR